MGLLLHDGRTTGKLSLSNCSVYVRGRSSDDRSLPHQFSSCSSSRSMRWSENKRIEDRVDDKVSGPDSDFSSSTVPGFNDEVLLGLFQPLL